MTVNHWWVNGIVDSSWSSVWGLPRAQQWVLKCEVREERERGFTLTQPGIRGLYESVMLHTHTHTLTMHSSCYYIILSHSVFYASFCHFQIQRVLMRCCCNKYPLISRPRHHDPAPLDWLAFSFHATQSLHHLFALKCVNKRAGMCTFLVLW